MPNAEAIADILPLCFRATSRNLFNEGFIGLLYFVVTAKAKGLFSLAKNDEILLSVTKEYDNRRFQFLYPFLYLYLYLFLFPGPCLCFSL